MPQAYAIAGTRLPANDCVLRDTIRQRTVGLDRLKAGPGDDAGLHVNVKATMMNPHGALLIARALLTRLGEAPVDFIGGVDMGAVPILGALAALSFIEGRPINTFFLRKPAGTHGDRYLVEGLSAEESLAGKRVMLIDDVAATGRALTETARAVRAMGADVREALVLVDQEGGAAGALAEIGIALQSVFRASQFEQRRAPELA